MGDADDKFDQRTQAVPPPIAELNTLSILGFQKAPQLDTTALDPPIGTATMDKDGTITLHLKGHTGMAEGETLLIYRRNDKHYQEIYDHINGIRPGQTKSVRPWNPREKGEQRQDTTPDTTDQTKPPEPPPPLSDSFKKSVQDSYDKLPDGVKKKLEDEGYKMAPVARTTDALPDLANSKPRGWPPGSTWDNVDGCCSHDKKLIVVAQSHRSADKWVANSSPDGVARHEMGHATDHALKDFSDSKEFKDAYARDVAKIPADKKDALSYFLQVDEAGHEETFAECFAVLNGGASYPGYTKDIQTYFPETLEAVRKKLDSLQQSQTQQGTAPPAQDGGANKPINQERIVQ